MLVGGFFKVLVWVLDWSGLWLVPSCCLDLSVFVVAGLFWHGLGRCCCLLGLDLYFICVVPSMFVFSFIGVL